MGSMLKIWIHLLKNELAPRFYGTIVEEILAVTHCLKDCVVLPQIGSIPSSWWLSEFASLQLCPCLVILSAQSKAVRNRRFSMR